MAQNTLLKSLREARLRREARMYAEREVHGELRATDKVANRQADAEVDRLGKLMEAENRRLAVDAETAESISAAFAKRGDRGNVEHNVLMPLMQRDLVAGVEHGSVTYVLPERRIMTTGGSGTGAEVVPVTLMSAMQQKVFDESGLLAAGPTIVVQPDAAIASPNCYALVEVKRIRRSSFQPKQLAREYVSVVRVARGRTPLLLVVLGEPPPVYVKGAGRLSLEDAVSRHLQGTLERIGDRGVREEALMGRLPDVLAWTTWETVQRVVTSQAESFTSEDRSVACTVTRLVASVTQAIERHS